MLLNLIIFVPLFVLALYRILVQTIHAISIPHDMEFTWSPLFRHLHSTQFSLALAEINSKSPLFSINLKRCVKIFWKNKGPVLRSPTSPVDSNTVYSCKIYYAKIVLNNMNGYRFPLFWVRKRWWTYWLPGRTDPLTAETLWRVRSLWHLSTSSSTTDWSRTRLKWARSSGPSSLLVWPKTKWTRSGAEGCWTPSCWIRVWNGFVYFFKGLCTVQMFVGLILKGSVFNFFFLQNWIFLYGSINHIMK